MLIVTALLIILPIGYVAMLKWNECKDKKMRQSAVVTVFLALLLLIIFSGVNLYNLLINHDERVVAQRYVDSLIENSINKDQTTFLSDVNTIAYEIEHTDAIFSAAVAAGFSENPGLFISRSAPRDSEGNVYLYVLTRDLKLGLDVELKPSGDFYDVCDVSVLDEAKRSAVEKQEEFTSIW